MPELPEMEIATRRLAAALPGETIESIDGVNSASVQLAIPKQTVFTERAADPTASVFVDAATPLSTDQVEAIRFAAGRARDAALAQGMAHAVRRVLGWPARLRARAELSALSNRELADIGLTRGDIDRVTG